MDKKKQLEFLRNELEQTIKMYLGNEVNYRASTAMTMGQNGRDEKVLAAQTQAKAGKEMLEIKIRNYRGLIMEIERGEFVV